jgi:hypothetical protein
MQATVKYPRIAAVLSEIENTGRTRAEIGRLAGRDGSAATRWAKGTHLPGWSAVKSLADAVRDSSPELAGRLLEAWHYYSDPVERGPGSTIPRDVLAVIRRNYSPDQQAEVIAMLEELAGGASGEGSAGSDPGTSTSRAG